MCFMINNDPKPVSVHQLIAEIKEYLELQRDLLKVEGVEKLTILISAFLVLMISIYRTKYYSWGRSSFLFAFCFGLFIGAGYWFDRSIRYYRLRLPIDISCRCFVEEATHN